MWFADLHATRNWQLALVCDHHGDRTSVLHDKFPNHASLTTRLARRLATVHPGWHFPGHPAIIDFHSFIITPSYVLITMEYLPRLVPVEVREPKAKTWFKSLLGGVAHLHARGIVHNDVNCYLVRSLLWRLSRHPSPHQPGNPLPGSTSRWLAAPRESSTSTKPVPFESSLAYDTPEYLSPEHARGHKHDTRKSDVVTGSYIL